MRKNSLWGKIYSMFEDSNRNISIYKGIESVGIQELSNLGINKDSALGGIILNTAGVCVDNWIRIIGQSNDEHGGICKYNRLGKDIECDFVKGMLIVAQDVVGGLFAVNVSKFSEDINNIWYFAPDTLEWESLDMDYAEFIEWVVDGNVDEFYVNMRWNTWKEDCKDIHFEQAYLIYPFLWAKECDLSTATKRIVPFEEMKAINLEYAKKFSEEM